MQVFVTGTDTNIGKTVISAWLCMHTKFSYWKPIQTGSSQGTDTAFIQKLGNINIYKESYCYDEPISPHLAARLRGAEIELHRVIMPAPESLIVEGAGGILVPINKQLLMVDLIKHLNIPVILVARSTLGTINHTLLTLEALRARNINVLGVIMNGPLNPDNRDAIELYGNTKVLAEVPLLKTINNKSLQAFSMPTLLQRTVGIQE